MKKNKEKNNQIVLYENDKGDIKLDVFLENETVWLSQSQMSLLFNKARRTIGEHIRNVYEEGELNEKPTRRKFRQVQDEGGRTVEREIEYYNLDVIISVGYRVRSQQGTQFRIWATERLKEYIIKGFTIDSDRLKNLGGGNYWKELLDQIRDIRSSEKVLYRQVLDLYATSVDYDPQASESLKF